MNKMKNSKTMKILGSTKKDVDKDKNGENVPKLESVEIVLVHCNLVKNDYQHASKILFIFVPNREFGPYLMVNFLLLKYRLQIKLVKHLKFKIMLI